MWAPAAIAVATAVAYLALAPAVVNGDGLGYLKAALDGTIYPGHVGYVPLLTGLGRLSGATRPVELLWPARVVSAAAAALAVAGVGALGRRRFGAAAGVAAALGLAASWGTLSAGSDVETYAPAMAALVGALLCAERQRPVAAGLCCAAAALLHVENVAFVPVAALLVGRRARDGATAPAPEWRAGAMATVAAAAALPVAAAYGVLVARHGLAWMGGASHGLHYPLRWTTPFVALYGACKALVYAPYPYEASWARVLGCFAVGAAALVSLATCARRPFGRLALAAWIAPYALVGLLFYGSDAERWTFLLPLLWLAAAAGRPRRARIVAAAVAAANLALWMPTAREAAVRARAEAAARHVADGDLVIGPGHGWDEYIGFWGGPRVRALPLVYWAGAVGRARLPAVVAREVAAARAGGHAVWLARLHGDDGDPLGWKELRLFGIGPAEARALLPPGRARDAGDGLERWAP